MTQTQPTPAVVETSELKQSAARRFFTKHFGSILGVLVFALALWLLHREIREHSIAEITASFRNISPTSLLIAFLLTLINYPVLIAYDWLAIKAIGKQVPLRKIVGASFLAYSIGNVLGSLLGGATIRYRLYSDSELTPSDVLKLVVFIGWTFWIGLFATSGMLFVAFPFELPSDSGFPLRASYPIGMVLIGLVGLYVLASFLFPKPIRLWAYSIQIPRPKLIAAQCFIVALDLFVASGVLYALMPESMSLGYVAFTSVFMFAIVAALISNVPGGLGVLELILIMVLGSQGRSDLIGALLAFRVIYYFLPFVSGILVLGIQESRVHHARLKQVSSVLKRIAAVVMPRVFYVCVFFTGIMLLFSGALPLDSARMPWLRSVLPLSVVEFSHFLNSIMGVAMLVLARGLRRRIDTAYWATLALVAISCLVSLAKGFDYELALLLAGLFILLLPFRSYYYRTGRLGFGGLDMKWFLAVSMVLVSTTWLLFFAHKHFELSGSLWWQFELNKEAPRSARALVGAIVFALVVGLSQLFSPAKRPPTLPSSTDLEDAKRIIEQSSNTTGFLGLMGDKRFVFSDERDAFVMFGVEGRSWIAMGPPIGPEKAAKLAAWKFRELCDTQGVWPAFYQVGDEDLSLCIDLGLSMIKLGEEAVVPLDEFTTGGSQRKSLRKNVEKLDKVGCRFEIWTPETVVARMSELKGISDAWLGNKNTAEKGFSVGFFASDYIRHFHVAVVLQNDNPIAFANLLITENKSELSVDLMRYIPNSPNGIMDYLFTEIMLWGNREGYASFNLGMAPLSGIESHRLSSWWSRVSSLAFRHGEHFYNFQGLRAYKEKFRPEWSPKYLASPGGFALPQILANISTLIAGGLLKLVRK